METKNPEQIIPTPKTDNFWKIFSIVVSVMFLTSLVYYAGNMSQLKTQSENTENELTLNTFTSGVELPIKWRDIGRRMTEEGVIDQFALENIYARRGGGLSDEEKSLINQSFEGKVVMTKQNAGYLLNLLWAFGLTNKNPILEKGPMQNPAHGGAGRFASTGGWTLARGNPMDHYSRHEMVKLTTEQQLLVEKVSKGIYRPCCGNSTYFPDCNHGMAMLGLLELMASNDSTEEEMYKVAFQVNSLWFPDTYSAIDQYLKMNSRSLASADPEEILGTEYSSASGYANILSQIQTPENKPNTGGGCAV